MDGRRATDETLTREDVSRLVDRSYLTERLMMLAAHHLTKDFASSAAQRFALANGTPMSFPRQEDQLLAVLHPLLQADSTALRFCLLPVFENIHWTLFILILSSAEIQVFHVDSIPPRRPRYLIKRMEKLLVTLIQREALGDIVDVSKIESLTQPTCGYPPDSGLYVLSAIESFTKVAAEQSLLARSSDFIRLYSMSLATSSVIQRCHVMALLNSSPEIQRFGNLGARVVPLTPTSVLQALPRDVDVADSFSASASASAPALPMLAMEAMSLSPTNDQIKREHEGFVPVVSSSCKVIVIEDDSGVASEAGGEVVSRTDEDRASGDATVARPISPMSEEAKDEEADDEEDVDFGMPSASSEEEDQVGSDALSSSRDERESESESESDEESREGSNEGSDEESGDGSGEDDESASAPDSSSESTTSDDLPWLPTSRLVSETAPPRSGFKRPTRSRTSTSDSNQSVSQSARTPNPTVDEDEPMDNNPDVQTSTVTGVNGPVRKKQKLREPSPPPESPPPEWDEWIKVLGNFRENPGNAGENSGTVRKNPITYQEVLVFKAMKKTKRMGDVNVEEYRRKADPIPAGKSLTRKNAMIMYELGFSTMLPHELIGSIVGYKTCSVNTKLSLMRRVFRKIDRYNSLQNESS